MTGKGSFKTTIFVIIWAIVGICFSPIFITGWLLRYVARFALAISYWFMLEFKIGTDVFKSLFSFYDTRI